MPHTAYPTALDLGQWLTDAGFAATLLACLDLETAVGAGRARFEATTGRRMLATAQTREYDLPTGPRGILDLKADIVSVTSLTVGGMAQVAGTDYRLLPVNAADDGRPYFMLQLARRFPQQWPLTFGWSALQVTGLWGYGATIPDDAWAAMLALAGLSLHAQIAQESAGGLEMWSEADVTERYGSDPLGGLRGNWERFALGEDGMGGVAGYYRRVAQG